MHRRFAETLLKLGLLVASTALALLGGELLLALAGVAEPEPRTWPGERENQHREHFIADREVGWRMRPGAEFRWTVGGIESVYYADAEGFRTAAPSGAPAGGSAAGRRRIVLVGDSFLWGFGVPYEASCGALLESRLDGVTVANRAMPGFGLDQVWLSLRHWALPLAPELVIVGLFVDDFNRSLHAYRPAEGFNKPTFRLAGERLVELGAGDRPGWLYRFLERRSRIFALGRHVDRKRGRLWGTGRWWSLNAAFLDAMRREAAAAGVPLLFVHIPYVEPIPFPALDAYMDRHGESYLGLPPWTPEQRRELFLEGDVHLGAGGHRFLADALEKIVRAHLAGEPRRVG